MSYTRILVHLVFTTKNRHPFLRTPEVRREVFRHIAENARKKNIMLDCINGHKDHAHCLLALGKEQTIAQVSQLLKGESSFWINRSRILIEHFEWQDDYWGVSVGIDEVDEIRLYIENQEEHHKKKTFDEELKELLKKWSEGRG